MSGEFDLPDGLQPSVSEFYKWYWYIAGCSATAALIGISDMYGFGVPSTYIAITGSLGMVGVCIAGVLAD